MSAPVCGTAGHAAGHVCLVPSARIGFPDLQEAIGSRFGEPRSLVTGGTVDPAASVRTGLPLLTPFGERVVEMRAWACGDRWIGCGTTHNGDGDVRLVVLVAEREDPAAGLGEPASWVDGIVAVTGWETAQVRTVDWAAVEARLGTPLPGDYKRLVEIFGGGGAFDGYLRLHVPDAYDRSTDIVRHTEWLGEWTRTHGGRLWDPYPVYPAPGGVLQWASSEQADGFYWLTGDPDPDRWPVLAQEEIPDSWVRFDGTAAEFVHRMLTEREHPFSTARHFDVHWFQSYEGECPPG
ncbi:SMI1/KNR4 family protein [Streptomyces sp. enrichment culture]|uniref:SMI1/KNR4 family protein n=1 Tax=Streptomyces sp. enrichment culture TaxID=1795815 RepID=UPI003F54F998